MFLLLSIQKNQAYVQAGSKLKIDALGGRDVKPSAFIPSARLLPCRFLRLFTI